MSVCLIGAVGEAMIDRGGVWAMPYQAHERLVLTTQAKFDRRMMARWYWRVLADDVPNGTAQDPVYGEAPLVHRKYAAPIPVHIYVDPTGRQKGQKRGRIDTTNPTATFGFSRAEAIRLGALLGTQDDYAVGLSTGVTVTEKLFIPRPGDVVLYNRRLYTIDQAEQEFLGPTDIVVNWPGKLALMADDIVSPLEHRLPPPVTLAPADPNAPPWPWSH